jgi:hypothetical protein
VDIFSANEISKLADDLIIYSAKYSESRKIASESKIKLDIILASRLSELRKKRSNIGYEMALIHLLEDDDGEIRGYYEKFVKETDHYKALERVIDALKTKISFAQSVMKWEKDNT